MSTERQGIVLRLVRSSERTTLADLAQQLGVSQMTVRRDLDALQHQGLVRRVRGGAVPSDHRPSEGPAPTSPRADPVPRSVAGPVPESAQPARPSPRWTAAPSAPPPLLLGPPQAAQRIAAAVAAGLSPGSTVLLDGGPLAAHVAAHLPARAPLTVVVMGLPAASALAGSPGITLLVLGGLASGDHHALGGPLAAAALGALDVDVLVMTSTTGTTATGWSTASLEHAELLAQALRRAERTVVAATASALGVRSLARVTALDQVHAVVTSTDVHDEARHPGAAAVVRALGASGIAVTVT